MSKIGAEILVNSQQLFDQTLSQSAKLNGGSFVTVWVDWASSIDTTIADGSWSAIKAQLFSANGVKAGPEILVNSATIDWQQDPHVVVLGNGNFVVTWTDGWDYFSWADHPGSLGVGGATGDTQGKAIKAQVFSAGGSPIGTEILVNTEMRSSQSAEKIVALANGNFVVTWEDWSLSCSYDANGNLQSCGGGPGIKAQLFDPIGGKIGHELAVTGSYNYAPQITALVDGGFVVAWHDGHYSVDDVWMQVYSASGVRVGSQMVVNTTGTGATFSTQNEEQIVALSNGGFAVAWTDLNGDDSYRGVKTQVFDGSGARVGSEIVVNTTTFQNQSHPKLAALSDGGFVVAWDDSSGETGLQGSAGVNINAQIFNDAGVRVGSEIVVNTTLPGNQSDTQITALDDGGFAVCWSEQWTEIRAQVFDALGNKVGSEVAANTTTAGGQSGAQIIGLDDATFVVAWNDNLYGPSDGSGSAVKAQVFAVDRTLIGTDADERLTGGRGDDTFTALLGNDTILGRGGNDSADGGAGVDTLILDATTADVLAHAAALVYEPGSISRLGSSLGTVDLSGIERVQLSDALFAFDTEAPSAGTPGGHVWQAAALYRAGFGAMPDQAALSQWTAQADHDSASMGVLGQKMVDHYAPGISSTDLVTHLYYMLMQVAPTAEVAQSLANQVGPGEIFSTQGDIFAYAASLSLNTDLMVGFAGSIQALAGEFFG